MPKLTEAEKARRAAVKAELATGANAAGALTQLLATPPAATDIGVPDPSSPFVWITHAQIQPDPDNARKEFDGLKLLDLAETIASHGLLQPLVVSPPDANGMHTLIAGERRWRAIGLLIGEPAKLNIHYCRWKADQPIPCRIETAEDQRRMEAALIENLQRVDLNHMEAGLAFETLGARFHLSNRKIAEKIGRSLEYVQQHRRLAALPESEQAKMRDGRLTMHEALQILAKPKPEQLGAKTMMVLAEIYHACKHRPAKGAGYTYWPKTECAYTADGGELEQLTNRQIVQFEAMNYTTRRAYVEIQSYNFAPFQDLLPALDAKRDLGWVALREFQIAAFPDTIIDPNRGLHKYLTPWLNGPFELSPEATKKIEEQKNAEAKAEAARAVAAAAEAAAMADVIELEEKLANNALSSQPAELLKLLAAAGLRWPVTVNNYSVVGADGKDVFYADYHFWEQRDLLARLLALVLNLAAGFGAADGAEAPPDPELEAEAAAMADDEAVDESGFS